MPNIATISGNLLTQSTVDLATLPSGSGTTNYLPKWTTSTSLGNSLIFDNGTNVGIGTTSPTYKLDVNGTIKSAGFIYAAGGNIGVDDSYGLFTTGNILRFGNGGINGTEAMRIAGSRNVLIGTTTDAGQKLQVSGTSSLGGDVVITTTTNARTLTIARGSSTNSINFQSSTGEFSFQNQGSHVIQVGNGTFQHASSRLTFSGFQNASYIEFKESSSNSQIFYIKNGDTQQWNWAKNLKIDGSTAASECAASSILELSSTTKGFLPPRMTAAQAEAISTPAEGLMVYATTGTGVTITSKGWWGYDGAAWVKLN